MHKLILILNKKGGYIMYTTLKEAYEDQKNHENENSFYDSSKKLDSADLLKYSQLLCMPNISMDDNETDSE